MTLTQRTRARLALAFGIAALIGGGVFLWRVAGVRNPPPPKTRLAVAQQRVADIAALGKQMFSDPSLSASGRQSCATCHSPSHDYGPPNDLATQFGGPDMKHVGARAVPSLKYLQAVPPFIEHFMGSEEDGNEGLDQGPTGGLTWDGRAPTRQAQAFLPLLDPDEMANPDLDAVIAKVKAAPYAGTVRKLYGDKVFDTKKEILAAIVQSLDYFQQTPAEFFPFDSKYDAYRRGKAQLNERELNGLKLFLAPDKGNCVSCHRFSNPRVLPIFNDFGLVALGVPRNPAIAANADPDYYDMGLCGPKRTDLSTHLEYCGLFRSPTLRNVARRKVFFHNGYFHDLRSVVEFYNLRDVNPERFYPRKAEGSVVKFDDLPTRQRGNVNMDPPFGGKPGGKPALTEPEVDDLVAFLNTLNDGYKP